MIMQDSSLLETHHMSDQFANCEGIQLLTMLLLGCCSMRFLALCGRGALTLLTTHVTGCALGRPLQGRDLWSGIMYGRTQSRENAQESTAACIVTWTTWEILCECIPSWIHIWRMLAYNLSFLLKVTYDLSLILVKLNVL